MKEVLKHSGLALLLLVLIVLWLVIYGVTKSSQPQNNQVANQTQVDSHGVTALAQCLTGKGYRLYGAYWCGHCQEQKEMFGAASTLLNYVECTTEGSDEQAEACQQAEINIYPTWIFPDGTKQPGLMTLAQLAKVSGCPLE